MTSTQTTTSSSTFSSPFHVPSDDPEAFGSYTSCQGPPTKPHASPVAKLRRHVTSALAPESPRQGAVSLEPQLFDTDIVILPFVSDSQSSTARAKSAPPAVPAPRKTSKRPATSSSLELVGPFGANILTLPFIADDVLHEPIDDRKVRRISNRTTVARTSRSAAATPSSEDDMTIKTTTPNNSRPNTAAGDGEDPPYGGSPPGAKGCQCPCGCPKCHIAHTKLCKCVCSCKSCRCQSRKVFNRFLRMLEGRGSARHRSDDCDPDGEKDVGSGRHESSS